MVVTTVSPFSTSPTEGDDLCETGVTNVAIHIVTLLICLCGLLGNGAVLCLLSLKDHNAYIFDLAFADLLFLLFTVASTLLFLLEDVSCSHIMPQLYLSFLFRLSVVSWYWVLLRLTRTGSVVNMFKLCRCCNIPERLLWLVDSVHYWAFFALFIVSHAVTNLCPSHQQDQCKATLIYMYTIILLLCATFMVISSTINFIKAKWGSKKQQPERREIVFFFIVLFILLVILCNFLQQLGYTVMSSDIFFLLNCLQSSIKPFIYFLVGRCWSPGSLRSLQLSLWKVFDEQKEKLPTAMMPPRTQGIEAGDPFHCSAEGCWESG